MKRIVILGPAGGGKSTLARSVGERLGAPVVHLDALYWEPGWKALPIETFRSRLTEAISGDTWITDGNYAIHTFDLRMRRADLVIWVERPRLHCIWRVFRRAISGYFRTDENLADGCKEKFDRRLLDRLRFITNFNRVNRPRIDAERFKMRSACSGESPMNAAANAEGQYSLEVLYRTDNPAYIDLSSDKRIR
jgi:adenylate kinase family enzyme